MGLRILVILLLAGCAEAPSPSFSTPVGCTAFWGPDSFPIAVSPDSSFTPERMADFDLGVQAWNIATERHVFTVVPMLLQTLYPTGPGVTFTHKPLAQNLLGYCPIVYKAGVGGLSGQAWRAVCSIDPSLIKTSEEYSHVVSHELGHALGFVHDESESSIMFPNIRGGPRKFPQEYVRAVRKMVNGTFKPEGITGLSSCL